MSEAPFIIVINRGSGSRNKDAKEKIADVLAAKGRAAEWIELSPGDEVKELVEQAGARAKKQGAVLVAAGGDGTVNLVAQACYMHKIPMGIIPLGTFNYLARFLAISTVPEEAASQLCDTVETHICAGFAQSRLFLTNASFGLYTRVIRNREEVNEKLGRFRPIAVLTSILTLLRGMPSFSIRLKGVPLASYQRTPLVFVCINPLQLEKLGLDAGCAREGKMSVMVVKDPRRRTTMRMLVRGLFKNLSEDPAVENFCAGDFHVQTKRKHIDTVIDGEIMRLRAPLHFRVEKEAIRVLAPVVRIE